MIEIKGKYYFCKTLRLRNYLFEQGINYIEMIPDIYKPKYFVWKYEITDELKSAINKYSNRDKSNIA